MFRINTKMMGAAALIALSGCSASDDLNDLPNNNNNNSNAEEVAVNFGSYLGRNASAKAHTTTRATSDDGAGEMTTTKLEDTGFGIFSYFTGTNTYEQERTTATPNFMYNTKVATSSWTYSPLRYWPNPTRVNNEEQDQYVSFFAYAPYVSSATTGYGITQLPSNTSTGDPKVQYTALPNSNGDFVDLLWGTANNSDAPASAKGSNSGVSLTDGDETTTANSLKVNADLTRQAATGKVKFNFKHALAKFGGSASSITINLNPDDGFNSTDNNTRVTVSSITVTPTSASVNNEGSFNLVTGEWSGLTTSTASTANSSISVSGSSLNTTIEEPSDDTELVAKDDAGTVTGWSSAMPEGVTTTAKNVASASISPMLIIPNQTPSFNIEITYIVRTLDPSLAKGYTEVSQTVDRTISFSNAVEMNKQYSIAIHIGLTSIKFDAQAEDWASDSTSSTTTPVEVTIP